jgi:hypothetical protein
MLWLFVFGCDGEERKLEELAAAAYEAGCDEGRLDGSIEGTDDGTECRDRAEIPAEAAQEGMLEYCASHGPTAEELLSSCGDDDCWPEAPCEQWEWGYRDCWPDTYDHSYRIGWDASDCDIDTAI